MNISIKSILENKKYIYISAVFSIMITLFTIPYDVYSKAHPISDFTNRTMSMATKANWNISIFLKSYYTILLLFVIAMIVIFILTLIILNKLKIDESDNQILVIIKNASIIGIFVWLINVLTNTTVYKSYYFLAVIIILNILYLLFKKLIYHRLNAILFQWALFTSVPATIFFGIFLYRKNPDMLKYEYLIIIYFFSVVMLTAFSQIVLIINYNKNNGSHEHNIKNIIIAGIPIMISPILQSIALEVYNVINKRFDIVLNIPYLTYVIITSVALISIVVIFIALRKRSLLKFNPDKIINNVYIPLLLMAFICIISQPYRYMTVIYEMFENANPGISIDHFVKYGQIPIIETFDAHMLKDQIFGHLYTLLNGYEPFAIELYDSMFSFIYFPIIYYIVREITDSKTSLIFVLFFPLLTIVFNPHIITGAIVAICLIRLNKKYDKKRLVAVWLAIYFCCLWALDVGFAATIAGVLTYVIISLVKRNFKNILRFLLTGIIVGMFFLAVFLVMCLIKNINPILWIKEFLSVSMSNQNWGLSNNMNRDTIVFTLDYYILPYILVVSLAALILYYIYQRCFSSNLLEKNRIKEKVLILTLFFGIYYIANLQRGMVFATLSIGNRTDVISGTVVLALGLLSQIKKKDLLKLLTCFLVLSVLTTGTNLETTKTQDLIQKSKTSTNYFSQYTTSIPFNGTRNEDNKNELVSPNIKIAKETFNLLLKENESFIDLTNNTLLFALLDRENPVYVNQSPLLISGDDSMKFALNDIKTANVPIAILPYDSSIIRWFRFGELNMEYKYYMLFEYVYENYDPLLKMDIGYVYCLKEKTQEYIKTIKDNEDIIFSKDEFTNIKESNISLNNMTMYTDNFGQLCFAKNDEDAFVDGLFNYLLKDSNYNEKNADAVTIEYEIKSEEDTEIEIFYIQNSETDFNQDNTKKWTLSSNKTTKINMTLDYVPYDIRIKTDAKLFTISKITVKWLSSGTFLVDKYDDTIFYDIGYIPMLWAEADDIINTLKVTNNFLEDKCTKFNGYYIGYPSHSSQPKSSYVLLEIDNNESEQNGSLRIKSNGEYLSYYDFTVLSGLHNYLIRISTSSYWWTNSYDEFNLFLPENSDIIRFEIVDAE